MANRQGEFPPTIQVECPECGFFNTVTLRYAEGSKADYAGVCGSELGAGGFCGASLLDTITVAEEALEDVEEE